MAYTDMHIIEEFTMGGCWALALELKKRMPHLTVCTLIDPYDVYSDDEETYDYMNWFHVVVLDPNTGMYFDAFGKHDPKDNFPDWEMFEWTEIYEIPDTDLDEYFLDEVHNYPVNYSTGEGAEMMEHGVMLATVDMLPLPAVA